MLADCSVVALVPTTDLERASHFYGEVLGLNMTHADSFACVFDAGGTMLRVTLVDALSPPPFTVLGWQVDDIAAVADGLTARGVVFQRYPGMDQDARGVWRAPSGDGVAWFKDTEGNTLSLTESAPPQG